MILSHNRPNHDLKWFSCKIVKDINFQDFILYSQCQDIAALKFQKYEVQCTLSTFLDTYKKKNQASPTFFVLIDP